MNRPGGVGGRLECGALFKGQHCHSLALASACHIICFSNRVQNQYLNVKLWVFFFSIGNKCKYEEKHCLDHQNVSRSCILQHVLYIMLGLGLDKTDAMGTRQIWSHVLETNSHSTWGHILLSPSHHAALHSVSPGPIKRGGRGRELLLSHPIVELFRLGDSTW